ncbi:MAG: hypothetical protein JW809_05310 [Pirellulales bacterium]|nr:hypothetical protein [Pirellulales bacterium]
MSDCVTLFRPYLFGGRNGPTCRLCRSGSMPWLCGSCRRLLTGLVPRLTRLDAFLDVGSVETNIWVCADDPLAEPRVGRRYTHPGPSDERPFER